MSLKICTIRPSFDLSRRPSYALSLGWRVIDRSALWRDGMRDIKWRNRNVEDGSVSGGESRQIRSSRSYRKRSWNRKEEAASCTSWVSFLFVTKVLSTSQPHGSNASKKCLSNVFFSEIIDAIVDASALEDMVAGFAPEYITRDKVGLLSQLWSLC